MCFEDLSFHNCAGNDTLIFCRSESNEKNHHHKDKKQTQSTNAFDSDESMKNDFKQTSDASTGKFDLCQIMFDDIGQKIFNASMNLTRSYISTMMTRYVPG